SVPKGGHISIANWRIVRSRALLPACGRRSAARCSREDTHRVISSCRSVGRHCRLGRSSAVIGSRLGKPLSGFALCRNPHAADTSVRAARAIGLAAGARYSDACGAALPPHPGGQVRRRRRVAAAAPVRAPATDGARREDGGSTPAVTPEMPQLAVIGAGRVGKALCRVWRQQSVFTIGDVLNRRAGSARAATSFIGAGRPIDDWAQLRRADVLMLSVPDDAITACVDKLKNSKAVGPGTIVFHCSGSKPSSLLAPLEASGARVASVHPVKSFADPALA